MPTKPNNATVIDLCVRRLRALESHVRRGTTMGINGRKHQLDEVLAIYQGCLDARAELDTHRATARAVMAKRERAEDARREADHALRAWVEAEFGIGSKEALEFGFAPPRKAQRTVDDKAKAVALAKATREARHTMGKKERLAIRGVVATPAASEPEPPPT